MFCINHYVNASKLVKINKKKESLSHRKLLIQKAENKTFKICLQASKDIENKELLQKCIDECHNNSSLLCDENDSY